MAPMEDIAFFRWAARYKFTLAMENYVSDDYTTEKLWRPLRLGSVPIVFGASNVKVGTRTTGYFICFNLLQNLRRLVFCCCNLVFHAIFKYTAVISYFALFFIFN